jgi:DNA-binding protein H-NS
MATAVRASARKASARKAPAPAKRKATKSSFKSGKLRALVYNLSGQELEELIRIASGRKDEQLASAKASFVAEVKTRAASLGVSLAELVRVGGMTTAERPKGAGRTPSGPKYRNPDTGETWSGRGRPAKWLTELEAKGRKRQEFAV